MMCQCDSIAQSAPSLTYAARQAGAGRVGQEANPVRGEVRVVRIVLCEVLLVRHAGIPLVVVIVCLVVPHRSDPEVQVDLKRSGM